MGTNFYFIENDNHIGKCSAAGWYCYDCNQTLCKAGEKGVHESQSDWDDKCPECDLPPNKSHSPAMVELGFEKPLTVKPQGVSGASSFSFAIEPADVVETCKEFLGQKIIKNEYGDTFTGSEFLTMIDANCPIRFTKNIGIEFC